MSRRNLKTVRWGTGMAEVVENTFTLGKVKNSYNSNMTSLVMGNEPLMGYSSLSSCKLTFATGVITPSGGIGCLAGRVKTLPPTVELFHKLTLYRKTKMVPILSSSELDWRLNLLSIVPVKKLLFDILKNLVTFTASNHCMCGKKRCK